MTEHNITRAQVDSALRLTAELIRLRLQDESAAEVRRIAMLLLPDFGFQVPRTKAEITALVTDFAKVNPLAAVKAFQIGLRRTTLAVIEADLDGRVVEPGLFREGPPIPQDPGRPMSYYRPE